MPAKLYITNNSVWCLTKCFLISRNTNETKVLSSRIFSQRVFERSFLNNEINDCLLPCHADNDALCLTVKLNLHTFKLRNVSQTARGLSYVAVFEWIMKVACYRR